MYIGENMKELLLSEVNMEKIPEHIAIIMDGNGRWAKQRHLPRLAGHKAGVESLREILKFSSDIGVKCLTVYAFSTENWKRPETEVTGLFKLLVLYLEKELNEIHGNNVKLKIIGDYNKLPLNVIEKINNALEKTKDNTGLTFNIALNYGSRDEIINAVKNMYTEIKNGNIKEEDINEKTISNMLYTYDIPDPDLIIRTSGELRLSNFLLWQSAYSELYFTDTFWPDFHKENLVEAIKEFQNRKRRYGGI